MPTGLPWPTFAPRCAQGASFATGVPERQTGLSVRPFAHPFAALRGHFSGSRNLPKTRSGRTNWVQTGGANLRKPLWCAELVCKRSWQDAKDAKKDNHSAAIRRAHGGKQGRTTHGGEQRRTAIRFCCSWRSWRLGGSKAVVSPGCSISLYVCRRSRAFFPQSAISNAAHGRQARNCTKSPGTAAATRLIPWLTGVLRWRTKELSEISRTAAGASPPSGLCAGLCRPVPGRLPGNAAGWRFSSKNWPTSPVPRARPISRRACATRAAGTPAVYDPIELLLPSWRLICVTAPGCLAGCPCKAGGWESAHEES